MCQIHQTLLKIFQWLVMALQIKSPQGKEEPMLSDPAAYLPHLPSSLFPRIQVFGGCLRTFAHTSPLCPECCSPSPLGLIPLLFQVKDPALREAFPIQHYSCNELMCHFCLPSFLDYKQREARQPCYWSVTVPSVSEILNF